MEYFLSINRTPYADNPHEYSCGFEAYRSEDVHDLAQAACMFVWSPHWWDEGRRHSDSWLGCRLLVLDFDSPDCTVDQMAYWLDCERLWAVVWRTKSFGIKGERFRVALLAENTINKHEYKEQYAELLSVPRFSTADKACSDLARWYAPSRDIVLSRHGNRFVTRIYAPENPEVGNRESHSKALSQKLDVPGAGESSLILTAASRAILRHGWRKGSRNRDLYQIACDCKRKGFGAQQTYDAISEWMGGFGGLGESEIAKVIQNAQSVRS